MQTRTLGAMSAPAIGLGAGGLVDGPDAVATVQAAIDAGMTFLDTADFYDAGANEDLIRRALRPGDRGRVQLSVKFGGLRDPAGRFVGVEGRPAHVRNFLAYSLQRLGTDHVDVYRPARLDPTVPIEDTVGTIAELVEAGYVRHVGLSEVGAETIRRAHAVHPIADVQIEYSLLNRGPERAILDTCRELGIGVSAYGVLAHGLLTGSYRPDAVGPGHLPQLATENLPSNLALVERLRPIADARGATVAQLAVAWVLAREPHLVALVGASRPSRVPDAVAAADLALSDADMTAIEEAVPPGAAAGERYAAPLMAMLDSER
ncbi:aldo/keto reductase [Pseudonocardia endophytica]|uniref:Pyridoxine 4-dehydrogenase n=1 Tax=Pseudonocardia endophytica TaxID=401976 RepID=A0A4R1I7X4_PSEEN|nr:aldo/keto reductase [Pseudonocardia endophytica]TCK26232.1 pyridoxine 4-dehydrogenase [Pseudonocardia endophytica]